MVVEMGIGLVQAFNIKEVGIVLRTRCTFNHRMMYAQQSFKLSKQSKVPLMARKFLDMLLQGKKLNAISNHL